MRLQLFCLCSLFAIGFEEANAKIKVDIRVSPLANLIYQMDCIQGPEISCGHPDFEKLWEQEFIKSVTDKEVLEDWGRLRLEYAVPPKFKESKKGEEWLTVKLRLASFQAIDRTDYLRRLDLVLTPEDRRRASKVVDYFYPRFEKWWRHYAQKKSLAVARELNTYLGNSVVKHRLVEFAKFYRSDLPKDFTVPLHLIFRPELVAENGWGERISGPYSVTEIRTSKNSNDAFGVVIHELCHFFYRAGSKTSLDNLRSEFIKGRGLEAVGGYNLINEALASAFGNGMIKKAIYGPEEWNSYYASKNSFYAVENIDLTAKAIMPWLENWLDEGKTLYDPDFISQFLAITKKAVGEKLLEPRQLLNEMMLISDGFDQKKIRRENP